MGKIHFVTACAVTFSIGCHHDEAVQTDKENCPAEWLQPAATDRAIVVPSGHPLFHAAAQGSQNYTCSETHNDAGTAYAWVFSGPEATLNDCKGMPVGQHIAGEAGPAAPRWETTDGVYVTGRKVAAWSPDSNAIPWLLLAIDGHGGRGPLSRANYVQRVNTKGGKTPETACDASNAGKVEKVPYSADYFFYGH